MLPKKYVAYYRVSTEKQGVTGLGMDAQQASVRAYVGDGILLEEVIEVESGKRDENRPGLQRALSLCRLHRAILITAKLDRLARNVKFIATLMESKVEFLALDFPEANSLTLHIMAAVAEYETKMISARTKAALKSAKARGVKLGTPNCDTIKRFAMKGGLASAVSRLLLSKANAADVLPVIRAITAAEQVSLRGIARELNRRSIPASRGGKWSDVQVARVLSRS